MLEILPRLLEFIAIFWLIRFVMRGLFGSGSQSQGPQQSQAGPFRASRQPSEPKVISGEMKKDPQCGTYVSTELSLKSRYGDETLHFCSRQCQEEFLQAHSSKRA